MITDNNEKNTHSHVSYEYDEDERRRADVPRAVRNIFGIFMVIVYVGMGVLLFINYFDFAPQFNWVRYVGGSLFVIYGIWRGYRQSKGMY